MGQPKKVVIFYTDAGGGHRATALALQTILRQNTPYTVTLCNPYRKLIADIDLFARFTRYSNEEVYNRFVLGKGWHSFLCLLYYGLTILNVKQGTRKSVTRFLKYWQKKTPDLVISVMPLANQGIYRSVRKYSEKRPVPFLVLMTDLEEKQKHIWFPPEQDYHIICGSKRGCRQAIKKPHPENLVHYISGLPVSPEFYRDEMDDRGKERSSLGLRPDWLTGCMMYGSAGSPRMVQLADALKKEEMKCQMIFLCGNNHALEKELEQLNLPYPHLICSYTRRVPYYFQLSDFLVCKPGPGTISEARVSGLKMVLDDYNVLPQERYNIGWLKERHAGLSFKGTSDFCHVVQGMITKEMVVESIPVRSAGRENRSIFEIPEIIRNIVQ